VTDGDIGVLALLAGIVVIAVTAYVPTRMAAAGRLGPNSLGGFRTRATKKSPEAWQAAHQAALIYVRYIPWTAVLFVALAIVAWIFLGSLAAFTAALTGMAFLVLFVLGAAAFAHIRARDID